MHINVYMLVPKDEFDEVTHKGKANRSAYKYAFKSVADDGLLTQETYLYTDNKEYYLFNMDYEFEYLNVCYERMLCIYEIFQQLSKYQIMVIKDDGSKVTLEIGMPYSKGFEYPPLKCPIEKSFKYLEKIKEYQNE